MLESQQKTIDSGSPVFKFHFSYFQLSNLGQASTIPYPQFSHVQKGDHSTLLLENTIHLDSVKQQQEVSEQTEATGPQSY